MSFFFNLCLFSNTFFLVVSFSFMNAISYSFVKFVYFEVLFVLLITVSQMFGFLLFGTSISQCWFSSKCLTFGWRVHVCLCECHFCLSPPVSMEWRQNGPLGWVYCEFIFWTKQLPSCLPLQPWDQSCLSCCLLLLSTAETGKKPPGVATSECSPPWTLCGFPPLSYPLALGLEHLWFCLFLLIFRDFICF